MLVRDKPRALIAVKQTRREIRGLVTEMLKRAFKRTQRLFLPLHLRKVREISFTDVMTCALFRMSKDLFCLIHEPVSVLKRQPKRRSSLQSICSEVLQLV